MKVIFERVKLRLPYRVLKGGACFNDPQSCRALGLRSNDPGDRSNFLGLRPLIRIKRLE